MAYDDDSSGEDEDDPYVKAQRLREQHRAWESRETRDGDTSIWHVLLPVSDAGTDPAAPDDEEPSIPSRVKLPLVEGLMAVGPWRLRRSEADADLQRLQDAVQEGTALEDVAAMATNLDKPPEPDLRFGRLVFVVAEHETEVIQKLLFAHRRHNAQVLGIGILDLMAHVFSPEELEDKELDVLTAVSVIDGKFRIMIFEGLRGRGIDAILKAVPRNSRPNSSSYKLLHSPTLGFEQRLYACFGPEVKHVKIRCPVEQLTIKPELYTRQNRWEADDLAGMMASKHLMSLKQMVRMKAVHDGACFPEADQIKSLEILYGGYLTDEELQGMPAPGSSAKKKPQVKAAKKGNLRRSPSGVASPSNIMSPMAKSQESFRSTQMSAASHFEDIIGASGAASFGDDATGIASSSRLTAGAKTRKSHLDMTNVGYEEGLLLKKSLSAPDFLQANKDRVRSMSLENEQVNDYFGKKRTRETSFLDGQQVYLYSGQKLNCAELQKSWMRATMDGQDEDRMWTFNPAYNSCEFSFTGAPEPGTASKLQGRCPSDTYAAVPGDGRRPWRSTPARPKEEFRKPTRDLLEMSCKAAYKREALLLKKGGRAPPAPMGAREVHEPFVENEWDRPPVCEDRHKPISTQVRFEPDRIPHQRVMSERPFDSQRICNQVNDFGPQPMFESVHLHGRPPGEDLYATARRHNLKHQADDKRKVLFGRSMKTFSHGSTRTGITAVDRMEPALKDRPARKAYKAEDGKMPASIFIEEEFHELGNPTRDFQTRMRENDNSAPYDVMTGTYVKRDPNIGTKRGCMSGSLTKAPWQHNADAVDAPAKQRGLHTCTTDFNATRPPPQSRFTESHIAKNATRKALSEAERTSVNACRHPADFGVVSVQS